MVTAHLVILDDIDLLLLCIDDITAHLVILDDIDLYLYGYCSLSNIRRH